MAMSKLKCVTVDISAKPLKLEDVYTSFKQSIGHLISEEIAKDPILKDLPRRMDSPTSLYVRNRNTPIYVVWATDDWITVGGIRCFSIESAVRKLSELIRLSSFA